MMLVKRLGSLIALVAGVVGIPVALLAWGRAGDLLSIRWSSVFAVRDDGTLLLGVLTVVGWVVWVVFAWSVVAEAVDLVRQRSAEAPVHPRMRHPSRAGFGGPLRLVARVLVASAFGVAVAVGPVVHPLGTGVGVVAAADDSHPNHPVATAPLVLAQQVPRAAPVATPTQAGYVHVVVAGEDLWSLAQRFYGDGSRWREILTANPGVVLDAVDDLRPGSRLLIVGGVQMVTVQRGDSLWALAARHLGDAERWPEIYRLNADKIADPDEIDIGWRLAVPLPVTSAADGSVAAEPSQGSHIAAGSETPPATGGTGVDESVSGQPGQGGAPSVSTATPSLPSPTSPTPSPSGEPAPTGPVDTARDGTRSGSAPSGSGLEPGSSPAAGGRISTSGSSPTSGAPSMSGGVSAPGREPTLGTGSTSGAGDGEGTTPARTPAQADPPSVGTGSTTAPRTPSPVGRASSAPGAPGTLAATAPGGSASATSAVAASPPMREAGMASVAPTATPTNPTVVRALPSATQPPRGGSDVATGQVGSPGSGGETRGAPAAASGDADRDATQSVGTVPEATRSVAAGGEESRSVGPEDQSSEPTGTGGEAGTVPDGESPPVDVAASAGRHGSAERSSSQAADFATGAPTPTGAAPAAGGGGLRASAPTTGAATADSWSAEVAADRAATAAGVTGLGALLAGGLMLVWRERRVQQLWARPVGRRILHPGADGQRFETALGVQAATGLAARVDALLRDDAMTPLIGAGSMLVIENDRVRVGARMLPLPDGPSTATVRLPAVVTLGSDDAGRHILVDLEREGALRVGGPAADYRRLALTMALELGCAPWAGAASTTVVGEVPAHVLAGVENVRVTEDVGEAIAAAVSLATVRRTELTSRAWTLAEARTGHDAVDAWAPEVLIFLEPLADDQRERLGRALDGLPVGIAAVLPVDASAADLAADACADLTVAAADLPADAFADLTIGAAVLTPSDGPVLTPSDGPVLTLTDGTVITPQLLTDATIPAIADLMTTTAGTDTTEAFWSGVPGGRGGFAQEVIPVGHRVSPGATEFSYPTLMLLGPIELIGAAGTPPPKAARSCLEYCGWLLEHPGTTASQMASALIVAEGTRRSNMSRLRTWLGTSPDGTVYLPDAYSGRIYLDSSVGSDWYRLQLLVSSGITEVSRETLIDALSLVRGAPLADAAPGQWHWAEELRTDIVSLVRDIGVVLAESAVASGDLDLARWATARALTVAGEDELLVCARIRTEHRAGNRPEVERLVLRLTTHARRLGVDLDPETVTLLQEVIEGRLRSRA